MCSTQDGDEVLTYVKQMEYNLFVLLACSRAFVMVGVSSFVSGCKQVLIKTRVLLKVSRQGDIQCAKWWQRKLVNLLKQTFANIVPSQIP